MEWLGYTLYREAGEVAAAVRGSTNKNLVRFIIWFLTSGVVGVLFFS
jgi:hypothetical protein